MTRPIAACAALVALLLGTIATSVGAATALTLEGDWPISRDVVVRWESDSAGPFTLLRRELPPDVAAGTALPLDPVADAWMSDLSTSGIVLRGEADLALPPDADSVVRVYQLIDASGGCSNAGYVGTVRLVDGTGALGARDLLSLPTRNSLPDARSLLERFPSLRRVEIAVADECRVTFLERERARLGGMNFAIGRDRAVRAIGATGDVVLVGAAASDSLPVQLGPSGAACAAKEYVAVPWGTSLGGRHELLCGPAGTWTDTSPADGLPDSCPSGWFDESTYNHINLLHFDDRSRSFHLFTVARNVFPPPGRTVFAGEPQPLLVTEGLLVLRSAPQTAPRYVEVRDAGAPASCRCADRDGDGIDDCSERLDGSDPSDPGSHGPDHDADGVHDGDDCPFDADPAQSDADSDGQGDACDPCPTEANDRCVDSDGDGLRIGEDDCPDVPNPDQADTDADVFGDACDNCLNLANDQSDADLDGIGDHCDPCPLSAIVDSDGDAFCDDVDDCPQVADPTQADADGDSFGDACECANPAWRLGEVQGVRVEKPVLGAPYLRRIWWTDSRAPPQDSSRYAVASGSLDALVRFRSFAGAECLAIGLRTTELFESLSMGNRWYLVTLRNACGTPDWGRSLGGPDLRVQLEADDPCR